MSVSRRAFLALSLGIGASGAGCFLSKTNGSTAKDQTFVHPLAIPPVLEGVNRNERKVFDLTVQNGVTSFFEGSKTPTMGYNGTYLGPTIRAKRGERISFRIHNKLHEETTVHWHGLHVPAVMDGGPHQKIAVDETWKPEFTVDQPAATLWYHSHQFHRTAIQVYHGLAGLFYVDDENSEKLSIPSEYGVDDFPIVIQDRMFNRDNSFYYSNSMHDQMMGMIGDVFLVNGVVNPRLVVKRQRIRFRILNGANAQTYFLRFSDSREFFQIATDGGFLKSPTSLTELRVAPGERAEVLVDLKPNDDVVLENRPQDGSGRGGMMNRGRSNESKGVLRITGNDTLRKSEEIPASLSAVRNWLPERAVKTRRLVFQMGMGMMSRSGGRFTINGRSIDINRIDQTVKLNDIEIWELVNRSPIPHPIHIHDIQFRILDRNGKTPPKNEQGLKDTVLVEPNETVRVITQFEHFADDKSPYMFHCHILEHEDGGMMGQFLVRKGR
ncbi:MAG: multicopper oxidase domain-containing protein [Pyrinomonadaceae bacterium]|nr:multicopper oxidase domain-containing protein [Pyrinomonadaceae bacterium]